MYPGGQGGGGEPADLGLHAADIRNDRTLLQARGDFAHERDDAIDGRGNHHEVGGPHGLSGGFRDGVAPRLSAQREACFRPAGPERDALRCAAGAGSLGGGAAE